MSKKFLTIFALVALLVAAMAGSAFAANEVTDLAKTGDSAIGALSPSIAGTTKTATLYYIDGVKSLDVAIVVSTDTGTGEISADLSADKAALFTVLSEDITSFVGDFKFIVGSFTDVPSVISVDNIADTGAVVTTKGQLTISTKKLEVVAEADTEITIGETFAPKSIDIVNFASYDLGTLELSNDLGKVFAATSIDIISDDEGAVMVTFDAANGSIRVEQIGNASGDAELRLYGTDFLFVEDDDAVVAGFDADTPLAVITITATRGGDDDPTAGMFKFDPANVTEEEGTRLDVAVEVTPASPDVLGTVTALNVAVLSDTSEGKALTEAIELINQASATSKDHFVISGDADVVGVMTLSIDVTTKSNDVETVTAGVKYVVTITAADEPDAPVVEPENMLDEAALEELEKLGAELIDLDVLNAMLDAGTATIETTSIFADLDTDNYYFAHPSANIEIPLSGLEGNAVPLTLTIEAGYGTFAFNESNLTKSADVFYEYVVGKSDGKTTPEPDRVINNWSDAFDKGVATVDASGNLHINYVVIDADYRKPYIAGNCLFIFDADEDEYILDPLWVAERKTSKSSGDSSSGVGCDAGFGAFALLGLAGMAAILRKKD